MKKIRRLALTFVSLTIILIFTSCGSKGGEVVYEMEQEGIKSVNTIEYDGEENITKLIMNTEKELQESIVGEDDNQSYLDLMENQLSEQKGVEFIGEIKDNKMIITLDYDMKIYIKDNKDKEDDPFSTLADEEGNLKLETMVKNLEDSGFKKK